MLSEEASWLRKSLQELVERGEAIFPLGNIGSSDEKQLKTQPWVNDVLMSPLRELGKVYNVDIKQSPDVRTSLPTLNLEKNLQDPLWRSFLRKATS